MKPKSLKTQLFFAIAILWLLIFTVSFFSYWLRSQAHDRLAASLNEGLSFITQLPEVVNILRSNDIYVQEYLLTGSHTSLEKRAAALRRMKMLNEAIDQLGIGPEMKAVWEQYHLELINYLEIQNRWIELKDKSKLTRLDVMKIITTQDPATNLAKLIRQI